MISLLLRFKGTKTTWYGFGKDPGSWSKEKSKFTIGSLRCVEYLTEK